MIFALAITVVAYLFAGICLTRLAVEIIGAERTDLESWDYFVQGVCVVIWPTVLVALILFGIVVLFGWFVSKVK